MNDTNDTDDDTTEVTETWLASTTDDDWTAAVEFPSRVEALIDGPDALGLEPDDVFYVARATPPSIPVADPYDFIEQMQLAAFHEVGEGACDWMEMVEEFQSNELRDMLQDTFETWLVRNGHWPSWFSVTDVEPAIVPRSSGYVS